MQSILQNRYTKLGLLTLGLAGIFLLLIALVFSLLGFSLPLYLQAVLCLLGAGYLVYRFFADRIY